MTSARSRILHRVRRSLATAVIPTDGRERQPIEPLWSDDAGALRNRFVQELQMVGVTCRIASTPEQVCAHVVEVVGGRPVFAWDCELLPYGAGAVLGASVASAGSSREEQAAAQVGVTGCHGAIAETGSIAVLSGRGMPRAASLLPPTHVCIVRTADLYPSIGAFFRAQAAAIAAAACCTFITGPSRTADIELTLTLGVHGPGAVVVVLGP